MTRNATQKDLFDVTSTRELLAALLLIGGFVVVTSITPALIAAAVPYAAARKTSKKKFQNTFNYMRRKGYIDVQSRRGNTHITLTAKGKKAARRGYFDTTLSAPKIPKKWDGLWRLIIFDVPSDDHVKRNAFRMLIKRLGARFLQQSVWVYPYDCREQVAFLKTFFDMDDSHVRLIVAKDIGDDAYFRAQFGV